MSDYEPPAESVEVLAKELHEAYRSTNRGCIASWVEASPIVHDGVRAEARFVLRRQHEREQILRVAMDRARLDLRTGRVTFMDISLGLELALAAHANLDAPKVPTLLEAAKAMVYGVADPLTNIAKYEALKAAVEREEKR